MIILAVVLGILLKPDLSFSTKATEVVSPTAAATLVSDPASQASAVDTVAQKKVVRGKSTY